MRLLELFSGTKSVGRAFEALGWEVTSLDTDATTRPTICTDVQAWDYGTYPPGHFDLIWASPLSTEFSRDLTRRPRRLEDGDRLVLKTIEIIGYLRPRWWAVENPRTGLLKSRPYMQALPYNDVSYCMYGFRYQKTTRIWNNLPWVPSQPICSKRSRCEARLRSMSIAGRGVAGDDSSFEFDIGETLHLQTGAKLSVFKFRVADAFLSTDRGQYLFWEDQALGTLNWATLPVGAYTGARLAAWISSNYASATYVEQTNEIGVAYDGNRRILNDQELRSLFPGSGSYPAPNRSNKSEKLVCKNITIS